LTPPAKPPPSPAGSGRNDPRAGGQRQTIAMKETAMAKATKKPRPWTKDDLHLLKTLVREKTKTSVVARKLKRTEGATRQKASTLGVKLAGASQRKR
jgi:hypothetical protein